MSSASATALVAEPFPKSAERDVAEEDYEGLDGQYPIQLGVLLEGVADRERGIPLGREPFAATAVRDDQNVVEHRFCTVAPHASRVRLAARP